MVAEGILAVEIWYALQSKRALWIFELDSCDQVWICPLKDFSTILVNRATDYQPPPTLPSNPLDMSTFTSITPSRVSANDFTLLIPRNRRYYCETHSLIILGSASPYTYATHRPLTIADKSNIRVKLDVTSNHFPAGSSGSHALVRLPQMLPICS